MAYIQKIDSHIHTIDGIECVSFAVWAPNAQWVNVIGDINSWDGRCNPLRNLSSGIWERFIPGLEVGCTYKFEIVCLTKLVSKQILMRNNLSFVLKLPQLLSIKIIINGKMTHGWIIVKTMTGLMKRYLFTKCHIGSWRRDEQGNFIKIRNAFEFTGKN